MVHIHLKAVPPINFLVFFLKMSDYHPQVNYSSSKLKK